MQQITLGQIAVSYSMTQNARTERLILYELCASSLQYEQRGVVVNQYPKMSRFRRQWTFGTKLSDVSGSVATSEGFSCESESNTSKNLPDN